jgi:hypothetical protein
MSQERGRKRLVMDFCRAVNHVSHLKPGHEPRLAFARWFDLHNLTPDEHKIGRQQWCRPRIPAVERFEHILRKWLRPDPARARRETLEATAEGDRGDEGTSDS